MDNAMLTDTAKRLRRSVLDMVVSAGRGHIGGSLSSADILAALYSGRMLNFDARDPAMPGRDRFILSKGHAVEVLYAALAEAGFFEQELLATYGSSGSPLGGHADHHVPGIEVSTGSLGHGLGLGAGMALAARLDAATWRTVVLLGDGECYEGSVWEAAMFAAHHRLSNLIAIVDRNGKATLDETESMNRLEPFEAKWEAFGWRALRIDGHSFDELTGAWDEASAADGPVVIIPDTVKGKGISYMEESLAWHHAVPRGDLLEVARRELGSDG